MKESGVFDLVSDDGTFLDEVQLRETFYMHMDEQCHNCGSEQTCHPHCCNGVLPGDTIYWTQSELYRDYVRFESATMAELMERGYADEEGNGLGAGLASSIRA